VLGLQFDIPRDALVMLMVSLAIGTPALSLIGAVGAGLTLGVRGGGALTSLLVLPLYVPVLIFGAGAFGAVVEAAPRFFRAFHFHVDDELGFAPLG
jgi:heme exporter protein B